jgi:hypothetical protein
MPRDNDKNNDSRGRRDRPSSGKGRSGVPRGPEKKFAKRGVAGKTEGERRPYAGKRDDRPPRREDRDAPRARSDRPFADRPSRGGEGEKRSFRPREDRGGDKRPYTPRGDRPDRDRDAPPPASRTRNSETGNSATRNLTRHERAARNGPIPRAVRASARTVMGREATVRSRPVREMAIVRVETGRLPGVPRENSTATRNTPATAAIAARARISVAGRVAAKNLAKTAAIPNRGRNEMPLRRIVRSATRVPPVMARGTSTAQNSTSHVTTGRMIARVANARVFPVRAVIAPKAIVRFASARNSILHAMIVRSSTAHAVIASATPGIATAPLGVPKAVPIGRSIPAASRARGALSARAGTMRTTARSLPNGRRSAAAAPIASAHLKSGALRARQRSRNPASASPRSSHGQGLPRAVTPKNGSCRGASRSMAV